VLYRIIRPAFTEHPKKIFLVCAGLMAAGIVFFLVGSRAKGLTLKPVTN